VLQKSQPFAHAVLQQMPSAQKPVAQSLAAEQDWPPTSLHSPVAPQVNAPLHRGDAALVTAVQTPNRVG
jgi:hypothetical protein